MRVWTERRKQQDGVFIRVRWDLPGGGRDQEKFEIFDAERAAQFAALVRLNNNRYPEPMQLVAFGFPVPASRFGAHTAVQWDSLGKALESLTAGTDLVPVNGGTPALPQGTLPEGLVPFLVAPTPVPVRSLTVEAACEEYMETRVRANRETLRKYRERLKRHVYPELGERQVADIVRLEMRHWQANLLNLGLSPKSIQNVRGDVLSPMFDWCCLEGEKGEPPLRKSNPLKGLPLPPRMRTPRQVLEDNREVDIFLRSAYTVDPNAAELLVVMLASGMRWGEIAGLPVENVLPNQSILVNQVYRREGNEWMIVPQPKTEAGYRTIPVAKPAWEIAWRRSEMRSPGRPVFAAPEGGFWRYSQFYDGRWKPIKALAVEKGVRIERFTMHVLRHSLLTRLADEGLELSTLAQIAGHKPGTTYAMYVHPTSRNHQKARELTGTLLPSQFGGWSVYDTD